MRLSLALASALALILAAPAGAAETRYSIVNGCFDVQGADGGPFRMQATTLAEYVLYSKDARYLAADGSLADAPSEQTEWRAADSGGGVTLTPIAGGDARSVGAKAEGCAAYPEVEVNATGKPAGSQPYEHVRGLTDGHMHWMAFEFLGGMAHCGRPWHKYGAPFALEDCADHTATDGCGAVLDDVLYTSPGRCHDPVGWPTFKDWPHHSSLTHETTYYKWVERAWRGGLRLMVNLLVENKALCDLYPLKRNSCNEMDSARLQDVDLGALQDYVDAQHGGPGKGWLRLVDDVYEARRVINQGKLAVVQGIEISQLFDCGVYNGEPQCTKDQIDEQLDRVYAMGIRQLELVNKFDNALAGVAGDGGEIGVITNQGNKKETGRYWDMKTCQVGEGDKEQIGVPRDLLIGNGLNALLPPGSVPVYGDPPHCNQLGLTDLGEYLVRQMMKRGMIIDPDHLSQAARDEVFALVEAENYHGVMSSHSWSNERDYPRIMARGGLVTPMAGSATGFVENWTKLRRGYDKRFFNGFGYGADMNGFAHQAGPRNPEKDPVVYPFKSFDGKVTLGKQTSGERVYDINTDGMAHYGLFPDWLEEARIVGGSGIVEEMSRGAEGYLQMWERAIGIRPSHRCPAGGGDFASRTLKRMRLGMTAEALLRTVRRQPLSRGRVWRYCVREPRTYERARNFVVFTPKARVGLIATTARSHRAGLIGVRDRTAKLKFAGRIGKSLRTRPAGRGNTFVYGVRKGRVRFVALASRPVASRRSTLQRYLRLARLR